MSNVVRIASVELKRSWRQFTTDRRQLLYAALSLCALLPVVGAIFVLADEYAYLLHAYLIRVDSSFLSQQLFVLMSILAFIVFLRTIQSLGSPSAPDLLLTTVPPESIVLGTLVAECIRVTLAVGTPLVVGSALLALETGAYSIIPLSASIVPIVVCFAVVVGYTVGMFWKAVTVRVFSLERRRRVFRIAGVVAVFVAITSITSILEWIGDTVAVFASLSPLTALVNIIMLPTSLGTDPTLGTFALAATTLLVIPILSRLSILLATLVWFSDDSRSSVGASRKPFEHTVARLNIKPANTNRQRVAVTQWKRGQRNPHRFSHILYSGFVVLPALLPTEGSGGSLQGLLLILPSILVVYIAWITGALFTLNPIGDEGSVLATLLTSPIERAVIVDGKMLAGLAGGIPLVVVLVGGTGFLGPLTIRQTALHICIGLLLSLYATAVAVGLGAFSPQFLESQVLTGRTVILPSTTTLSVYSMIVVPSSILFLLFIFIPRALRLLPPFTGMTGQSLQLYGLPLLIAWFAISGGTCYRYAIERARTYRYD